jgi:hypothetical protein
MEVFDAELYAISEGLRTIPTSNLRPSTLRICIDNAASVLAFLEKSSTEGGTYKAKTTFLSFTTLGWEIGVA